METRYDGAATTGCCRRLGIPDRSRCITCAPADNPFVAELRWPNWLQAFKEIRKKRSVFKKAFTGSRSFAVAFPTSNLREL